MDFSKSVVFSMVFFMVGFLCKSFQKHTCCHSDSKTHSLKTYQTGGNYSTKNSIRDARTPQPGEIFFNTMGYRSSETVQSSRYFQSSVSYIKVQIMLK